MGFRRIDYTFYATLGEHVHVWYARCQNGLGRGHTRASDTH